MSKGDEYVPPTAGLRSDTGAQVLQPIEDAPEGVDLQLWQTNGAYTHSDKRHRITNGKLYWCEDDYWVETVFPCALYSLWPQLPEPKPSWHEYLNASGNFYAREASSHGSVFLDDRSFGQQTERRKEVMALRDFLNFYHPPEGTSANTAGESHNKNPNLTNKPKE